MDLFKLGLRSILGITMPGTILVLVFLYTLFSIIYALNQPLDIFSWSKDHQPLILVILFLVSYLLGSLMRLNASDNVDKKSADHFREHSKDSDLSKEKVYKVYKIYKVYKKLAGRFRKYNKDNDPSKEGDDKFEKVKKQLHAHIEDDSEMSKPLKDALKDALPKEDLKKFDEWICKNEDFPYPVWQFRKFELYHPRDVLKFFEKYRRCMGTGSGGTRKEFFNYCKMAIYHASRQLGDAVVEEVHFAEAMVRFYAGTYYALRISFWMLLALSMLQVIFFFIFKVNSEKQPALAISMAVTPMKIISMGVTAILIVAVFKMKQMIVARFRTLRLKEVDTVYDAFYLIHQNIDNHLMRSRSTGVITGEIPQTGAELVEYWHKEGVIGTRPDVIDSQAHARQIREDAERRTRS